MSEAMNAFPSLASSATGRVAADTLFASLYRDLHRLARRQILVRGSRAALGATTLLHEAYLRIADRADLVFADAPRFLAYASRVMRGLVIDHVRRRRAVKRGGLLEITALDTTLAIPLTNVRELQRMSDALDELASVDPPSATVVDLKFSCGFSFGEIAAMHGLSERTVQRQWEKARIYLRRALGEAVVAA